MLLFFCRYENFWDIGIHLKPHLRKQLRNSSAYFSLTSASKPQTALVLYVQVWRHRDHRNRSTKWWCSTNWAMKPLTLGAGQLWVHMFPWKKWVLMIYEINPIWTAEMKWKWRNDRRSERNLCNCVKKPEKNSGLHNWPAPNVSDFIAQLVEHRTANREVTGSNPVEVLNFFQASLCNCVNCVHCDDHFFIFKTFFVPASPITMCIKHN